MMTGFMENGKCSSRVIDKVGVTSDTLTSRGGLSFFVRYLRNIGLAPHLERLFGSIRKSAKGQPIDKQLKSAGLGHWLEPKWIIECAHGRGRDELVHRGLKDFGPEALPMKRFAPNTVFYYIMLVAFFLYECFKEDVCATVVPIGAYATTLRRKVIDIAAKIVRTSGKTILKVTTAIWRHLHIEELWLKSGHPPHFAWA